MDFSLRDVKTHIPVRLDDTKRLGYAYHFYGCGFFHLNPPSENDRESPRDSPYHPRVLTALCAVPYFAPLTS